MRTPRQNTALVAHFTWGIGLTYRMVDYWTRLGILHAEIPTPGSGHPRYWSPKELDVAALIARCRAVGLDLTTSAIIAREHVEHGQGMIDLGEGITVLVSKRDRREGMPHEES